MAIRAGPTSSALAAGSSASAVSSTKSTHSEREPNDMVTVVGQADTEGAVLSRPRESSRRSSAVAIRHGGSARCSWQRSQRSWSTCPTATRAQHIRLRKRSRANGASFPSSCPYAMPKITWATSSLKSIGGAGLNGACEAFALALARVRRRPRAQIAHAAAREREHRDRGAACAAAGSGR